LAVHWPLIDASVPRTPRSLGRAIAAIGQGSGTTGGANLVIVRLVTNPTTDAEFQNYAEERAAGVTTPEELKRLLNDRYPRAHVVRGVTDIVERWYVYRDGRWVNSKDR